MTNACEGVPGNADPDYCDRCDEVIHMAPRDLREVATGARLVGDDERGHFVAQTLAVHVLAGHL